MVTQMRPMGFERDQVRPLEGGRNNPDRAVEYLLTVFEAPGCRRAGRRPAAPERRRWRPRWDPATLCRRRYGGDARSIGAGALNLFPKGIPNIEGGQDGDGHMLDFCVTIRSFKPFASWCKETHKSYNRCSPSCSVKNHGPYHLIKLNQEGYSSTQQARLPDNIQEIMADFGGGRSSELDGEGEGDVQIELTAEEAQYG